MNKIGFAITVALLWTVIKLLIGALIIIALIAGCYKIYSLTLPSIDSGTEKSFNQLIETIELMSKENYDGENPVFLQTFYIAPNLALVGFDKDKDIRNVKDTTVTSDIKRPYQCGNTEVNSCLTVCYFGENIDKDSCSGEYLKLVKPLKIDSLGNVLIRGESRVLGTNLGPVELQILKQEDGNFDINYI